jgi:hypothetical protein
MKEILASWKPADLNDKRRSLPSSEKGWENSLLAHLRAELPSDFTIMPQAGAGKLRGDIVVERRSVLGAGVIRDTIELKKGLASTGTYKDLVGQIQTYRREKGWTFAVICGDDVKDDLMRMLKDQFRKDHERLGIFWKTGPSRGVKVLVSDLVGQ